MVTKPISADDECDLYGIQMVKLQDPQLAKRYGIKTFPSLVYFRNGNPLTYDGRLIHPSLDQILKSDVNHVMPSFFDFNHVHTMYTVSKTVRVFSMIRCHHIFIERLRTLPRRARDRPSPRDSNHKFGGV